MMINPKTPSPMRVQYLKLQKKNKSLITFWQIFILLSFVLLWEALARADIIDSFIMSSPSRILDTMVNLGDSNLLKHVLVTCFETLTGFALGVILGNIIAFSLWWSKTFSKIMQPYLVILNALPKIALGPVIIIWVGASWHAIIVMALAISLIVTVLEMQNGFASTDEDLVKMATAFGATKRQIFFKIIYPFNIGTLFSSLKVNIGLSLVGVIAGEFLVSKAGLGYLIVYGGQVFQMDLVMTSVIILAALAAVLYKGVTFLEKKVLLAISH